MIAAMASLIVGCGFLGTRIAQRLTDRGERVIGTTTDAAPADAGIELLRLDVAHPPKLDLPDELDVYYLVPRRAGADGPANVVRTIGPQRIRRAVLASSTVVYGQDNAVVDADTPPAPGDDRGLMQLDAENSWLRFGDRFRVVRLAGLYGPDRLIGRRALIDGAPMVGNAHATLTLIHVEDAADLMIAVMQSDTAARVELGVDDRPAPRIEYYRHLAKRLGAGDPIALDPDQAHEILGLDADRLRRAISKCCDNTPTKQRTGWAPRYADYRAGIDQALLTGAPR